VDMTLDNVVIQRINTSSKTLARILDEDLQVNAKVQYTRYETKMDTKS
jgi:hypothetical protein